MTNRGSSQKVAELQAMVDAQKRQLLALRSDHDQIAVYQRDVDAAQHAYDAVAQRLSQVNMEGQNNQANTRLLSPAVEPLEPSRPKILVGIVGSILGGLAAGILAALGVEIARSARAHARRPARDGRRSGDRRAASGRIEAAGLPPPADGGAVAPAATRAGRAGDALVKTAVSMLGTAPRATRSLGAILIDGGQLKPEDAERVLQFQKQHNLRFGEAAVRLGLISEADIQFALSRQFAYAYLRKTPGEARPLSDELVAAYQPFSPRVEQMRAIRSQLMLRWFDRAEERQVLTVVGAERGEGRSYLAANLAIVFSQLGERTLLVDADMREPRQHYLFHLENQIGFSTLLAGRSREEAIVRIPDLAGLSVLPAGPTPPNPLELLNRLNFDEFMIQVKGAYDVVIVDTPAMTSGEDAAMIAVRTGAALAVARSGSTRVAAFTDLVQGLMDAGVAVVGSVLNEVPLKKKEVEVSSVLPPLGARPRRGARRRARRWLVALAGFAAMYLPVYWWAANGIWQTDEQAHGALILAGDALAVLGPARARSPRSPARPAPGWGWPLFAFGLLVYFVGQVFRSRSSSSARSRSSSPGILLLLQGPRRDPRRVVRAVLLHLHDPACRASSSTPSPGR